MISYRLLKLTAFSSFIFAILCGVLFSPLWIMQSILWILLSFVIYYLFFKASDLKYKKFYIYVVLSYLIIESLLKVIIFYSVGNGVNLNLAEHFLWSFYFSAIIYYPIFLYLKGKNIILKCIVLISIVNLVGVFNELIEFTFRYLSGLKELPYYKDTIRDLLMNILGSILFSLIVIFKFGKKTNS